LAQTLLIRSATREFDMYKPVNMEKLACLRRRLAIEADAAMMAALTHLWEKETERTGMAIQKEIDKRDAKSEQ
jgi:hypothetical protein